VAAQLAASQEGLSSMSESVIAERLVIWVLLNLGMNDHIQAAMLDGIRRHLGGLRRDYHFGVSYT
jgi:hypothetical protein